MSFPITNTAPSEFSSGKKTRSFPSEFLSQKPTDRFINRVHIKGESFQSRHRRHPPSLHNPWQTESIFREKPYRDQAVRWPERPVFPDSVLLIEGGLGDLVPGCQRRRNDFDDKVGSPTDAPAVNFRPITHDQQVRLRHGFDSVIGLVRLRKTVVHRRRESSHCLSFSQLPSCPAS